MTTPKTVTVDPSGQAKAAFFAAVRKRGVLNSMLDEPVRVYEKLHPDERCRWEFAPANGDTTLVVAREALGFHVVDASEIADQMTESFAKSGPVRRGDLVLMAAPVYIVEMIEEEDAKAAAEDLKLPERTYRDSLEGNKVRTKSGTEDYAKPVGNIKQTTEEFQVKVPNEEE